MSFLSMAAKQGMFLRVNNRQGKGSARRYADVFLFLTSVNFSG